MGGSPGRDGFRLMGTWGEVGEGERWVRGDGIWGTMGTFLLPATFVLPYLLLTTLLARLLAGDLLDDLDDLEHRVRAAVTHLVRVRGMVRVRIGVGVRVRVGLGLEALPTL